MHDRVIIAVLVHTTNLFFLLDKTIFFLRSCAINLPSYIHTKCVLDEDKWKTETKTEGGAIQEYLISYQNLVPSTTYTFRVIAFNKYGISLPAKSADEVCRT